MNVLMMKSILQFIAIGLFPSFMLDWYFGGIIGTAYLMGLSVGTLIQGISDLQYWKWYQKELKKILDHYEGKEIKGLTRIK